MRRRAKWMKLLTQAELKHMRSQLSTFSLTAFKRLRERQAEIKAELVELVGEERGTLTEPCWECRRIESKLKEAGAL